jgi:multidrug efflux pump subunit AcrA (membrane-fusion protein)
MSGSDSDRSRRKAKIYGVALAALVAIGSLILVMVSQEPKQAQSSPSPARAAIVPQMAESKSEAEITFRGKSFAPYQWRLGMKFSGKFKKIKVSEGQRVKKDQTLIEYDLEEASVAQLESALNPHQVRELEQALYNQRIQLEKVKDVSLPVARLKLERSEKDLEEVRELHAKGLAAADLLDQQERAVLMDKKKIEELEETAKQLMSQIRKIKSDLKYAKAAHERQVSLYEWRGERSYSKEKQKDLPLEKAFVKAPEDGIVLWISPMAREEALFEKGMHAITVARMNKIIVRCKVHELDLVKLSPGDRGVVSFDAIPEMQYPCLVSRIPWVSRNPALEVPADYDIECLLENVDGRIKEGLTCNVKISISQ